MSNLVIRPISIRDANAFVKDYHRHSIPTVGGKFAIACYYAGVLVGVAICGRPVSRKLDDGETLEIYRNCTNGTRNACSKLYGACVRVALAMGYTKIVTYTLEDENGASLKASNFICSGRAGGKEWNGQRKREYYISPPKLKNRWEYIKKRDL